MTLLTERTRPTSLSWTLAALLLIASSPLSAASHAAVFMYHRFGQSETPSTNVRLEQFETQLDLLEREGYTVMELGVLVNRLAAGEGVPDRTVAITVDDAYRSIYTRAFPRLRQRGWPITIFVSTDIVDRGGANYLTWAQMREMRDSGLVSFANHSASHDHLVRQREGENRRQWRQRIREDIGRAQRRLQEELGQAVNTEPALFAYPYGEYNRALANLVVEEGYLAFGQHSGALGKHSDPRAYPRYPIAEAFSELDSFRRKASSLPLPVARVSPWDPMAAEHRNPPTMTVELRSQSPLSAAQVTCYYRGQRLEPETVNGSATEFRVTAGRPLPAGRSRYNCTAPAGGGRYYWYSHPWLIPGAWD